MSRVGIFLILAALACSTLQAVEYLDCEAQNDCPF